MQSKGVSAFVLSSQLWHSGMFAVELTRGSGIHGPESRRLALYCYPLQFPTHAGPQFSTQMTLSAVWREDQRSPGGRPVSYRRQGRKALSSLYHQPTAD